MGSQDKPNRGLNFALLIGTLIGSVSTVYALTVLEVVVALVIFVFAKRVVAKSAAKSMLLGSAIAFIIGFACYFIAGH